MAEGEAKARAAPGVELLALIDERLNELDRMFEDGGLMLARARLAMVADALADAKLVAERSGQPN